MKDTICCWVSVGLRDIHLHVQIFNYLVCCSLLIPQESPLQFWNNWFCTLALAHCQCCLQSMCTPLELCPTQKRAWQQVRWCKCIKIMLKILLKVAHFISIMQYKEVVQPVKSALPVKLLQVSNDHSGMGETTHSCPATSPDTVW